MGRPIRTNNWVPGHTTGNRLSAKDIARFPLYVKDERDDQGKLVLPDDHNVLLSDEVVYAAMRELPQKKRAEFRAMIPIPRGQLLLLVFLSSTNVNWHQFQAHLTYQLPSHIPPVFTDIEFLSGKPSLLGEDDTVSFKYCIRGPGDIQIIQMGSSIAIRGDLLEVT